MAEPTWTNENLPAAELRALPAAGEFSATLDWIAPESPSGKGFSPFPILYLT